MKILLIQPPRWNKNLSLAIGDQEPLGLETIAGMLSDHEIILLDMRYDEDKLELTLENFKPNIVGITGTTSEYYKICDVLQRVKNSSKDILTVVGGVHATLVPQDFKKDYVDIIVIGEGEITIKELVETYEQKKDLFKIKGLAINKKNKLIFTKKRQVIQDLNKIPIPDRSFNIEYRKFYSRGKYKPMASLYSTKGCPYRCTFCCTWIMGDKKFRIRGVDIFIKDLLSIDEYYIFICDDNTIHNVEYSEELYKAVKDLGIKKEYQFYGRADKINQNPSLIEKWRSIGLKRVFIGVEHISDERLKNIKKGTTRNINDKALKILKELDIEIIASFIINPDFEKKDFDNIIRYCNEMSISDPLFTCLTGFPGTQTYTDMFDKMIDNNYEHFDTLHCIYKTKILKNAFYNYFASLYEKTYLNKNNIVANYTPDQIKQILSCFKEEYSIQDS